MYTKHHFAVIWLMPKQLSTNIFSPYWVLPSNLFSHKSAGDFCVAQISSFYFAKKKKRARFRHLKGCYIFASVWRCLIEPENDFCTFR